MSDGTKKPSARKRTQAPRGAAKRTAEAGAGKTSRESARQKEPLINRALRDLRVVQWKAEGYTVPEIARMDGRAERTIKGILESHAAHGVTGSAALLQRDPITLMEEALGRVEAIYQAAFEVALDAEGVTSRIASLRLMMDAQLRKMELLQHLGLLPRQLGTFRHVLDIREIGEQMVTVLLAVEQGEKTPGDAVVFFRKLANYGRPGIPEQAGHGEAA